MLSLQFAVIFPQESMSVRKAEPKTMCDKTLEEEEDEDSGFELVRLFIIALHPDICFSTLAVVLLLRFFKSLCSCYFFMFRKIHRLLAPRVYLDLLLAQLC